MQCGLVLEGGARRGLFTAGVLDRLYEFGVDFPYIAGVSAGAQAAINYVSRQPGRSRFMMTPNSEEKTPILLSLIHISSHRLKESCAGECRLQRKS